MTKAEKVLTAKFGRHVGLDADWIAQVWRVSRGPANLSDGLYIVDDEGVEETYSLILRILDDDEWVDTELASSPAKKIDELIVLARKMDKKVVQLRRLFTSFPKMHIALAKP